MKDRRKDKRDDSRPLRPLSVDPTRTSGLRRKFVAQLRRQFSSLKVAVLKFVGEGDAFGVTANAAEFQFHSDPDKVKAFQEWLKQQLAALIVGKTEEELWERFIQEGFRKGIGRAFDDVNVAKRASKYGGDEKLDFYDGTREEFLRSSFGRPVAVEKVKLLAGRSFDELDNVTVDMSNKMSRVLVDGLVQGKGPRDIARDMTKELDISYKRATTIAQHELIRAHSEGQLEAFDNLGIEEVGAAVEFSNSEDDRVCPACEALEGIVLKLEEAHGIIPCHVGCRCSWTPANVGEDDKGQKDTKKSIDRAFKTAQETADVEPGTRISKGRPESILGNSSLPQEDRLGALLERFSDSINPSHVEQHV